MYAPAAASHSQLARMGKIYTKLMESISLCQEMGTPGPVHRISTGFHNKHLHPNHVVLESSEHIKAHIKEWVDMSRREPAAASCQRCFARVRSCGCLAVFLEPGTRNHKVSSWGGVTRGR